MNKPLTVESTIHFRRRGRGSRKEMREGDAGCARAPGRANTSDLEVYGPGDPL